MICGHDILKNVFLTRSRKGCFYSLSLQSVQSVLKIEKWTNYQGVVYFKKGNSSRTNQHILLKCQECLGYPLGLLILGTHLLVSVLAAFAMITDQNNSGNFHRRSVSRCRCRHLVAQPLFVQLKHWSNCWTAAPNHFFCVCVTGFGAEESRCGCSRGDHRRGLSLYLQCPVCLWNPGTHTLTNWHRSASPAHVL